MEITQRSLFTLIHGMLFGAFFLMAVYGLLVELLRSAFSEPPSPLSAKAQTLARVYLFCAAALGWAAVLTGAYLIYPWYRAVPPAGVTDLAAFPRYLLKSSPTTSQWHDLGMEWKEHIAWIAPIAMTMVAWVLTKYRAVMRQHAHLRTSVLVFALAAFTAAGIAGFFGAMLNKYAPVNGGSMIHLIGKAHE